MTVLIDADTIVAFIGSVGITHLVWIPDTVMGTWDSAVTREPDLSVVRPSREGEAIAIAGGLWLGGKRPLVAIQSTGFFEAGDALRNIVHDLKVPLFGILGYRSYFARQQGSWDTAPVFTEPVLQAWSIPFTLVETPIDAGRLSELYQRAQADHQTHFVVLAE